MKQNEGSQERARASGVQPDAGNGSEGAAYSAPPWGADRSPVERPPLPRPRASALPPPDPAEALYYEGMAAYQHRNWADALARFSRLKELQPTRPGLEALLDEVRWFLQLQAAAPTPSASAGAVLVASRGFRPGRRWHTGLILLLASVGVIALLLIAFQSRLPWFNSSERGAQELYNRGQARLAVGDYEGAQVAFQQLLALTPDDLEAQLGLKRAERQQALAQGYAAAEAAIAQEDWDRASVEIQKVLAIDGSYRGAQARADFIAQRQRLAELYRDGGRLYDLGRWQDAVLQFQKIREIDAGYRAEAVGEFLFSSYLNAGQMLVGGESSLAAIQRAVDYFANALVIKPRNRQAADARRLGGLYLDGLRALDAANAADAPARVADAQSRFDTLLAEDPNYANGQAGVRYYAFLMQQADAAVAAGNIGVALRLYGIAQSVPVVDHASAARGAAIARAITPTPTPQPVSTVGATTAPAQTPPVLVVYAVAASDAVNLRAGPGLGYPIIGQTTPAERLAVGGRNADSSWLRVCTKPGDTIPCPEDANAWVSAERMTVQGARDGLAVVTPPPLPTPGAVQTRATAPAATPALAPSAPCIQGRVLDTRGGAALVGWEINLRGPDGMTDRRTTDNDGFYRFTGLRPGSYTVMLTVPGNYRPVSPTTAAITPPSGPACATVDFWNERAESAPAPLR